MNKIRILCCITLLSFTLQAQDIQFWHPVVTLTDSVACNAVADQYTSPTCWTFGSNSLFESDLIKKYNLRVNLSEMFYARYAYIDKAARYLATRGKTYFEGGGQFHDIIRVIKKYGMVPETVYTGRPHNEKHHEHSRLDTAMQQLVKKFLRRGKTYLTTTDTRRMNDTLDKYLGKVPAVFMYNKKLYTALSFAKELLHFTNDYAEIVSFSDQPLYQKFILKDKYNWANDSFMNVTLDDMKMIADTALANGWSLGWEGDVTETGFNYYYGYAMADSLPSAIDAQRLANYAIESTERDHMLHMVGDGYDSTHKHWYYMKNSWGKSNFLEGYMYMDENYFRYKTVILFVNKAALPQKLKGKMGF